MFIRNNGLYSSLNKLLSQWQSKRTQRTREKSQALSPKANTVDLSQCATSLSENGERRIPSSTKSNLRNFLQRLHQSPSINESSSPSPNQNSLQPKCLAPYLFVLIFGVICFTFEIFIAPVLSLADPLLFYAQTPDLITYSQVLKILGMAILTILVIISMAVYKKTFGEIRIES